MGIDQRLIDAVIHFIDTRFPGNQPEGAAGMYTATGKLLISTAPDTLNDTVSLCHETGCLCQAYTLNEPIVSSVCMYRESPGRFIILTPCGVCQERLFLYGPDVMVGVPASHDPTQWVAKRLGELQPYYWRNALS
ncbi:cytidine deaminase [Spirosoma oryzae]|uniref:Cytidine deaminase n=1 Tax=Spirosoma oryzae TaxID=1469603 RepID=A0A2T0SH99_9BACT|nr:cytidine deaminase [Spirosoma oryzae]PRY32785.1 cytidine deaminase [Spirosoma oryzae]